ncbi:hypothetical protein BCR36DRAFT_415277 [Piromyces finnis]|uniref:Uncharacterized protein n=1 Tax=Piromyces finnis TaxID=1754191 RepID=A0A1Y1UZ71_9FUNG|nr:hypothetical protein BCR36DRAFT_415277 [Piromyces finnis]|eukprot:ORX43912.1 hypothetical protein BCR36DRAFT_415277 [Piromyces finnis]
MDFFDRCICCPCISKELYIKIFTFILFMIHAIFAFYLIIYLIDYGVNLLFILMIASIFIYIYIFYGFKSNNLKQLKIVKVLSLIISIIQIMITIISGSYIVCMMYFYNTLINNSLAITIIVIVIPCLVFGLVLIDYCISTLRYFNRLIRAYESEGSVRN